MEDFEGKEDCIEIQRESLGSINDSKWEKKRLKMVLSGSACQYAHCTGENHRLSSCLVVSPH